jgi:hypothetical protein
MLAEMVLVISALYRLPDNGFQLFRGGPARVGEIDFVVLLGFPVEIVSVGMDEGVQTPNVLRFGGIRPDVHELC